MPERPNTDWAGGIWSYLAIWGLPMAVVLIGAFATVPARTVIWAAALTWMGFACLLNSRRCGRVHCRFTGPFYLFLIIPVILFGTGVFAQRDYVWVILGLLIVFGGKLIWWATEAAWGRYQNSNGSC